MCVQRHFCRVNKCDFWPHRSITLNFEPPSLWNKVRYLHHFNMMCSDDGTNLAFVIYRYQSHQLIGTLWKIHLKLHSIKDSLSLCKTKWNDVDIALRCVEISSNSTGTSFPVTSSRTCWRRRQLPRNKLAISYEEVSDTPDHLDMSRWSESRQLPRN